MFNTIGCSLCSVNICLLVCSSTGKTESLSQPGFVASLAACLYNNVWLALGTECANAWLLTVVFLCIISHATVHTHHHCMHFIKTLSHGKAFGRTRPGSKKGYILISMGTTAGYIVAIFGVCYQNVLSAGKKRKVRKANPAGAETPMQVCSCLHSMFCQLCNQQRSTIHWLLGVKQPYSKPPSQPSLPLNSPP